MMNFQQEADRFVIFLVGLVLTTLAGRRAQTPPARETKPAASASSALLAGSEHVLRSTASQQGAAFPDRLWCPFRPCPRSAMSILVSMAVNTLSVGTLVVCFILLQMVRCSRRNREHNSLCHDLLFL